MFQWTRRMPYWQTLTFFANQIFLRKTIRRYKVVSSSKWSFTKKFPWSHGFCFGHPCRNLLPQIRNFFIKNQKNSQTYFFGEKNPFVSKLFSGHMECGVDNSAKIFSPRNRQLLADCPKVKKFWFVPNYFPEVLFSAGHVESLPGSSSFSFEVFADAKVAYVTTVAFPFSKNMEIFRQKAGKGLNLHFFLEKMFNLLQKLLWSHGMQFWQHCQSYFAKNPNNSRSVPKKYESFVTSRN